jgi:hypothetical protein
MVIDFESDLFVGTAMMQIKNVLPHPRSSEDATNVDNNRTGSYFRDKKRTFQGIIWGRFKRPGVPMLECICPRGSSLGRRCQSFAASRPSSRPAWTAADCVS